MQQANALIVTESDKIYKLAFLVHEDQSKLRQAFKIGLNYPWSSKMGWARREKMHFKFIQIIVICLEFTWLNSSHIADSIKVVTSEHFVVSRSEELSSTKRKENAFLNCQCQTQMSVAKMEVLHGKVVPQTVCYVCVLCGLKASFYLSVNSFSLTFVRSRLFTLEWYQQALLLSRSFGVSHCP